MAGFELIAAIDLLEGRCVGLTQGRYDEATIYDDDPAAVAARFGAFGVPRLHLVDLDGARAGEPRNRDAIRAVVKAGGGVPVQLGGGLRSLAAVEAAFELGVDRVVLGSAAVSNPELVREAARRFPSRVAVSIDARGGRAAVEGWRKTSDARVEEVARPLEDAGVAALVYTDVDRDGMLSGPDLEGAVGLAACIALPVIVAGGVSSEEDVRHAAALAGRGIAGLIVGRALYTGAVNLERALRVAGCC